MKILLAEDEAKLGTSIKRQLKGYGYVVDWVQDGIDAKNSALNFAYDAIIMDINLPKKDGISVIKLLRDTGCSTPILVLTANNKITDCVEALNSGADDYLSKPFHYDEINVRLNALVRRERRTFCPVSEYRELVLDDRKHELRISGEVVKLTRKEYALLQLLISDPTRTVTRDRLLETIYGFDDESSSNTLEVYIHGLRKKLGKEYIRTVRGVGYTMG